MWLRAADRAYSLPLIIHVHFIENASQLRALYSWMHMKLELESVSWKSAQSVNTGGACTPHAPHALFAAGSYHSRELFIHRDTPRQECPCVFVSQQGCAGHV